MDLKKLESELEQEFEKVKLLKTKLEWINLVGAMSKSTTNLSILKEPEIKAAYEFSEPNMNLNSMLSYVFAFIFSSFLVIGLEVSSKKQTYSDMDEKTVLANKNKIDLSTLQTKILINNIKDLAVISLAKSDKAQKYLETLKREVANVSISLTDKNSPLDEHIKSIMSAENIVFVGQLGYTERKAFNQLKDVAKELKKNVINTFLIV